MYSPYSAIFKDRYWGGVPITLFAIGAFAFFAAFALYLLLGRDRAPRRAFQFFGVVSTTPLAVSVFMFFLAATRLGQFCKTCMGIYASSAMLATGGIAMLVLEAREARSRATGPSQTIGETDKTLLDPSQRPTGGPMLAPTWLVALGGFAVAPALLYIAALPSYAPYIAGCGTLEKKDTAGVLLQVKSASARQRATMLVDPLCPSCKSLHQRLDAEGVLEQLDLTLVLFPLDECNWNVSQPLHPGACLVSRAIVCADKRAMNVLDWAYENQAEITSQAKAAAGLPNVKRMIRDRFPDLAACVDAKESQLRLDKMIRFASDNGVPIMTPQLFIGDTRLCDEDSDIGLSYTLRKLAPELAQRSAR